MVRGEKQKLPRKQKRHGISGHLFLKAEGGEMKFLHKCSF